jgi:acyl-CoA thioester hydrolase
MALAQTVARVRVIYGDTDKMGVVYYANYLRYFEAARAELFRLAGGSYTRMEDEGFGLPVVEALAQYKAPARYDDLLAISVAVTAVKKASIRFEYQIRLDGHERVLALGHTVHACVGPNGKPAGLPEWVVRLLAG